MNCSWYLFIVYMFFVTIIRFNAYAYDLADLIDLQIKKPVEVCTSNNVYYRSVFDMRTLTKYPKVWYNNLELGNFSFQGEASLMTFNEEKYVNIYLNEFINKPKTDGYWYFINILYANNFEKSIVWHSNQMLTMLFRFARCAQNYEPLDNCPNFCNELPCRRNHTKEFSCETYLDARIQPPISLELSKNDRFANIFRQRFRCTCEEGYIYEKDKNICKPDPGICEDKEDKPCYNGAHCNYNGTNEDQIYSCIRIAFVPRFRINIYFYSFR